MNSVVTASLIIMIILIGIFIIVGIWFRKLATSSDDFLLAGRSAPFWLMASAYLGGFVGGSSVSGYVNLGFNGGISNMWTSLFVLLGCVCSMILFSRRLNYFGRKTGAVTITDFVCARYGESLRLPAAIASFIRPGVITGMQFLAIAIVAEIVFGIPIGVGIVLSAVMIMLYLITAGQYSALVTQWFQVITQNIGIMFFAFAAYRLVGNPIEVGQAMYDALDGKIVNLWSVNISMFTVWLCTFCLFYFCDPWLYMWGYMGKTPRISSNAMIAVLSGSYYNVMPFISGIILLVGVTLGKLTVPTGLSGDGLYAWFSIEHAPPVVGVIILVGLLTTILSCGSSFVMNGVTILTRDIYNRVINKNATEKQLLLASRLSLFIITALGIAMALWLPILVPLWSLGQALVVSGLFAVVLSAWFWRRSTSKAALVACIGGFSVALIWAMYLWATTGNPGGFINVGGLSVHCAHVGILTSFVLMITVSFATKPEYEKADVTNHKVLGEEMKTSALVPDKQIKKGFFGWLGAETFTWKLFWVITAALFILHFLLAFVFHIYIFGMLMTWISIIAGVGLIFILFFLGGNDLLGMIKGAKSTDKK